jgi:hypothetical protein
LAHERVTHLRQGCGAQAGIAVLAIARVGSAATTAAEIAARVRQRSGARAALAVARRI